SARWPRPIAAPLARVHPERTPPRRCWDRSAVPAEILSSPVLQHRPVDSAQRAAIFRSGNGFPATVGSAARLSGIPCLPGPTCLGFQKPRLSIRAPLLNSARAWPAPSRTEWRNPNTCAPQCIKLPDRQEIRASTCEGNPPPCRIDFLPWRNECRGARHYGGTLCRCSEPAPSLIAELPRCSFPTLRVQARADWTGWKRLWQQVSLEKSVQGIKTTQAKARPGWKSRNCA